MIELLLYLSAQTHAPTGEPITASHKLTVMQVILLGSGEKVAIESALFCPLIGLGHPKSLPRLLRQLADMELIGIESTRTAGGQKASPLVYPLPKIKRKPSNMEVTRAEPSNIQVTGSAEPSNIQVTRDEPSNIQVTRLSVDPRKDLEPPSNIQVTRDNGTVVAFKSPSPNLINKEGVAGSPSNLEVTRLRDYPSVKLWVELTNEDITPEAAKIIATRVKHLPVWRETLEGWIASRWAKTNVAGQIERYEKKAVTYTPPPEERKPKDPQEEERIKKLMYAE